MFGVSCKKFLHVATVFCWSIFLAFPPQSFAAEKNKCLELLSNLGVHHFDFRPFSLSPLDVFLMERSFGPMQTSRPHLQFPDAPEKTFEEVVSIFSNEGRPEASIGDISLFWSQDFQEIWNRVPQRKAESDMMAAKLVSQRLDEYKAIGGLVIVDSGHAHSVAIAVELAIAGYLPVIKMGLAARPNSWLQAVAAMKYYAHEMEIAKSTIPKNAPIAIIMNTHRGDTFDIGEPKFVDYQPSDFPSPQEVKDKYNNSIIWITEGEERGVVQRDDYTPPEFQHYRDKGVILYQHHANPYHNGTPPHTISLLPE